MIFILSSICRKLELWSVTHTSTYEDSEWNVFKNGKYSGEISNNWPIYLLGTNLYRTLEFVLGIEWFWV